ncbi:hypothetical protein RFI_20567 [Reticulomyxa filosa]|uniref:Uncharacterized protein n=1 Tax=Reticulomyxa filosa TaxID=46433 RepID=X6MSY1_RETFI|nr:hypothetical protein RFI_20567 [Reticulomyxa filosa]|eukprot:ETO16771.1 hypothetical protein RFI_20567 [Reticulomyxa filosa]
MKNEKIILFNNMYYTFKRKHYNNNFACKFVLLFERKINFFGLKFQIFNKNRYGKSFCIFKQALTQTTIYACFGKLKIVNVWGLGKLCAKKKKLKLFFLFKISSITTSDKALIESICDQIIHTIVYLLSRHVLNHQHTLKTSSSYLK